MQLQETCVVPPTRHPPEELLLDYSSGAASAPESLMIAAHLARCPECRRLTIACDALGGVFLDALAPTSMPPNMLNRTLAAIDQGGAEDAEESGSVIADLGKLPETSGWRKVPGGYGMLRVPCASDTGRVWLLKAPAGKGLLRHRHVGDEWTVVMRGAFRDQTGRYGPGDFAYLADGFEHQPIAEPGQDCVCLIMIRDQPRYTTLIGKLAAPFVRL